MILNKKQTISAFMTDTNSNLSIIGSFQIIQDAITELTGLLKIDGITAKEQYNSMWVFTKTVVKFYKNIVWNSEINVSCFISYISIAKMYLDVQVTDASGEKVLYSRTEACALDLETKRIKKLSAVGVDNTMLTENIQTDITFAPFDIVDLPLIDKVQIKYTNIDMSHHTNNIEYLRFILNTFSVKDIETKPIKEIEIVYSNQSFEGDILDIKKTTKEENDYILLEKDGKIVVKCKISHKF